MSSLTFNELIVFKCY